MRNRRLGDLRRRRGLSLMGLAARVHASPSWVLNLEKYGHVPGLELQRRIALALGVRVADVWPDQGGPASEEATGLGDETLEAIVGDEIDRAVPQDSSEVQACLKEASFARK